MYTKGYKGRKTAKGLKESLKDKLNPMKKERVLSGLAAMKKGGSAKKKKQGYKDRKDESIAMRVKKKRSAKQLKASADDSYGKFGSKAKKSGKINK